MSVEFPVHFEHRRVATIVADAQTTSLTYDGAWLGSPESFPISLSMPLQREPHDGERVLPWVMNLLPEGDPLRAMTRALGAAPEDVLGLIRETGADLAGALSIGGRGPGGEPDYRPIPDEEALERILNELPARPFLVGESGVSMSLAGAQEKLPVAVVDGQIALPVNGAASTHILKPDNPRLTDSVQNEALCMVLARRIGLEIAPVTTGRAGSRSDLLVGRYDRFGEGKGVRRLHQEDFCQALARPPSAKYEFNGTGVRGPSLPDMFGLARKHMTARDITRLLDAAIFNIAIGNHLMRSRNPFG